MPLLSIIIVTWNSEEFIKNCLQSIFNSQVSTDFEVVVIDNASQDETDKIIQEYFHQVKLISNQKNLGYAKGNNQGIEIARGGYILLLNPDVDLKENCLQLMLDFMEKHKEIDGLGPQLLNLNGTFLQGVPGLSNAFLGNFGLEFSFPQE
jgi:GT2 family glycosyltransferase